MNTVLFSANGKEMTMSSREIAELTGKQHGHVMRDIRSMCDDIGVEINPKVDHQSNQGLTVEYCDQTKRANNYLLNRELTDCLLTGYSAKMRMAVIKRWHELEQATVEPKFTLPDFTNPVESARAWANEVEAKMLALEENKLQTELISSLDEKILKDAPLVEYANDVHNSINVLSFSDTAKSLGVGRNDLFSFCRANKLLMSTRQDWNVPYQQYINSGIFEVKQDVFQLPNGDIKRTNTTYVTGKGHRKLHKMLNEL